jgi:hypothetical protein
VRTSALLQNWKAPSDVVLAGLAHAAYGTDGFATALFGLDERALVADMIGDDAERIVYRYASCDRAFTYRTMGGSDEVRFRDRFTDTIETPAADDLRWFAELTFANELDLVQYSEAFRQQYGPAVSALFSRWERHVSPAAWAEHLRLRDRGDER